MPQVAAEPTAGAPAGSSGWREAITPLSRSSRRRWVVAYALLLIVTGVLTGWSDDVGAPNVDYGPPLVAVFALFTIFGMLRRGTRQVAAFDGPALDERDRQQLASAFRYAYPLFGAIALASLAVLALALPETESGTYSVGATEVVGQRFLLSGEVLIGLALWGLFWAVFLPTGVLAWREPNSVLPDGLGDVVAGELVRDVVLAIGIAAAVYVSVIGDTWIYGWLALVVAVAIATASGRRERLGRLHAR